MQDLLSGLQPPIVIGLIIVVIIALAAVVFLARWLRNRQTPLGDGLGPSLDAPVDYTSLPLDEEPHGWRERFAKLSLAGKILAVLVPVLAVLGLLALVLTLLPQSGSPPPIVPPTVAIAVNLTVDRATVIRAEPVTVNLTVTTVGIQDGTVLTAELLEDGQPFAWLNPEQAHGTVRRNRAEIKTQRVTGAPATSDSREYTVIVRSPDGTTSAAAKLEVPTVGGIADSFYGRIAATALPKPTSVPTTRPTASPELTPEPLPSATPAMPAGSAASVINGGNVRSQPVRDAKNVVGGINAGEQVQIIKRTPNGQWYYIRSIRDESGWVSASLIKVPAGIQVPIANVVTVFINGPVYDKADSASTEVDRVNKNEVVELLQRTAAGDWYQVTNVRAISGWVPAKLLGIPAAVANAVPTVGANPVPTTVSDTAPTAAPKTPIAAPKLPTVAVGPTVASERP